MLTYNGSVPVLSGIREPSCALCMTEKTEFSAAFTFTFYPFSHQVIINHPLVPLIHSQQVCLVARPSTLHRHAVINPSAPHKVRHAHHCYHACVCRRFGCRRCPDPRVASSLTGAICRHDLEVFRCLCVPDCSVGHQEKLCFGFRVACGVRSHRRKSSTLCEPVPERDQGI